MKKLLLSLFCFATFTAISQTPTFEWAKQMKGTSDASDNEGISVTTDIAGNVYSTGYFTGTVDFDPGTATFNLTANDSGTRYNTFISKLDRDGNFIWVKSIGGTDFVEPTDIIVDEAGNLYSTGDFVETVDFNPGSGTFYLTADSASTNAFILKLDASGNFIWAKHIGGNGAETFTSSITTDPSHNIYIAGNFSNSVDFDPGVATAFDTAIGGTDLFISKLDNAGNFIWAKHTGGGTNSGAASVITDAIGNVYSAGWYQGTVDFDPGAGTVNYTAAGSFDTYISKLDTDGNFIWAKTISGPDFETAFSIARDTSGNIYTAGYFTGTVDFDPGAAISNLTNPGFYNTFILKLDASGNFLWAKQVSGDGYNVGLSVAVDLPGNVYTSGYFKNATDFDPGAGTFNLATAVGATDMFVLKLNSEGNFVWAVSTNSSGGSAVGGQAITLDTAANVFTTGFFAGTADFDPSAETANLTCTVSGNDVFVQKLSHILSTTEGITEQENTILSVFPNPATDQITIYFDPTKTTSSIEIKNLLGETVYADVLKNGTGKQTKSVDVSALAKGIYFIQLNNMNVINSVKFVKE